MKPLVRIANAGGYWGDDPEALYRQVTGGAVDYVTADFLAEITMVILHRQRTRNPEAGFAYDFLQQLKPALPIIADRGITVIVNAGGINPQGCATAVAGLCREAGVALPIGLVGGDDILSRLDEFEAGGVCLDHMDGVRSYAEIRGKVAAANVYLGAKPVVEALRRGARVIVTGRTTDAALILAPLVHEFGWAWDDWNRLAAGVVAGHILECGAQATGGNFTDWRSLPSMLDMGYPIVEAEADGSFVVTKHAGTGGAVTCATVTEQLLYEIGDPEAYLTPDVSADFTSIELATDGVDRVRVSGVRGVPPPCTLKASVVYRDGFKAVGTALLSGPDVVAKGRCLADMIFHRLGTDFAEHRVDFVGYRGCWGGAAPEVEPNEVVFRVGVRDQDRRRLERFAAHFLGFGLQAPPGFGIFGGRPDVQEALGFWPALVPRELITAQVELIDGERHEVGKVAMRLPGAGLPNMRSGDAPEGAAPSAYAMSGPVERVKLGKIAYARSGDKGDHANIGVVARSEAAFAFLRQALTPARVKEYYADLVRGDVVRYELANLQAFNFLLLNALGGGGTLSLRVDHQGKTLAQGLLQLQLDVPVGMLAGLRAAAARVGP
jgi:Acyclic terpene utilisation family protein AtuA